LRRSYILFHEIRVRSWHLLLHAGFMRSPQGLSAKACRRCRQADILEVMDTSATTPSFDEALASRVDHILDACTRCGKCVEACPITEPASVPTAAAQDVAAGVLEILRTGDGPEASRRWASSCVLSGDCIKACNDGINPRFMLTMARSAMAKSKSEPPARRSRGVQDFRTLNQDVTVLSRLQLSGDMLARLGQQRGADTASAPDFVFYTGCNVLKTPHIALLALDIMDALGASYRVMGGPSHCCGIMQLRAGDTETSGRFGANTIDKLAQSKTGQVLSWCPSCYVQFTETTLPTLERTHGSRPFEITPFMLYLEGSLDRLRPLLRERVDMRIALHRHPGVPGVVEAAIAVLNAVPGVTVVDLGQPAVGLMSNALRALPEYKKQLHRAELEAARDAGVDALAAVYHADHRELCAHERDWPFAIINILEVVGASMGLRHEDRYKRLKILQDADAIVADCADLIAANGLDPAQARDVVVSAMLAEQPLPLVGSSRS
jgi:heterodisulfide reductase subunit D